MMNTLFAANPTGATVWMMRAMGLGMLSLGAKTCGGSDADAATTGLIFYAKGDGVEMDEEKARLKSKSAQLYSFMFLFSFYIFDYFFKH